MLEVDVYHIEQIELDIMQTIYTKFLFEILF